MPRWIDWGSMSSTSTTPISTTPDTPLEESIGVLSALVDEGKVRYLGISNFSAERIEEWLRITEANGFHRPVAFQQMYSLVERGVEETTPPIARRSGIGFIPHYVLARGFLTGKYRAGATLESPRAGAASAYFGREGTPGSRRDGGGRRDPWRGDGHGRIGLGRRPARNRCANLQSSEPRPTQGPGCLPAPRSQRCRADSPHRGVGLAGVPSSGVTGGQAAPLCRAGRCCRTSGRS